MNILVIKFRNIGDVLLTAPLITALHTAGHRVSALVKSGTEAMLEGHPQLDDVLVYPMRSQGEGRLAYLRRELAFYRQLRARRFDLAINTTEGDRGVIAAFLSGAQRRRGPFTPGRDNRWRRYLLTETVNPRDTHLRHTVLRNLDLGHPDAANIPIAVTLHINDADRDTVRRLLDAQGYDSARPLVHIHPTSRWFFKCWTEDGMAATIDYLIANGAQVALSCAPDGHERAKLDAILARCRQRPFDLGGRLTLKQTAALSAIAAVFFGVDTAPMHMAAAVGTPVVAIFGPSGAFDWGPWPNGWRSDANPYPARNGVQSAGAHLVIQQSWDCAPCGQAGCNNSKRSDCLERTGTTQVIAALDAALARSHVR
ncbi:putative lipopolysaccharide heptosyltransferase III [Acidihalobacter ferrooxydans]|uniref:Putative lipopolysaccharide heptosyltransferase III n=1 Tax=Acidihalobacter ferrooxydans TaxID=1765967 RepID=A0A1P8UJ02_9GAMM|nr:putative lipopolysaccharide heptosyltransferase III [Acidihalobacter ferrooxydans]APZ43808.1 putative lipopolysaccharide heptosyltransferase III [Acidihalobacter ferrooxydans]